MPERVLFGACHGVRGPVYRHVRGSRGRVATAHRLRLYIAHSNAGWAYAHDMARQKLGMDPANVTCFAESISEGDEVEAVITNMSELGYDVVVTTSFNLMDATIKMAKEFPNVTYLHCAGFKTSENVSTFFGRMYQARYLSGLVAWRMTKSNIISFVAAHAIPEVKRGYQCLHPRRAGREPRGRGPRYLVRHLVRPVYRMRCDQKLVAQGG